MAVIISGSSGITSVNGSAAAPSVTGTDTDTGIVYGTNTLSIATGGTTAVTVGSNQVVTFAQAPVLPAASIPQAALASNVAGNGPAFSVVWSGAAQSITSSTFTKVQATSELFDTNSNYDTVNSRFTPTVAGYYQLNAGIGFNSSGSATRIIASLFKNGSEFARGNFTPVYSSQNGDVTVSSLVYLNGSTDYIELYGYMTATSPNFGGVGAETYFNGFLARAA